MNRDGICDTIRTRGSGLSPEGPSRPMNGRTGTCRHLRASSRPLSPIRARTPCIARAQGPCPTRCSCTPDTSSGAPPLRPRRSRIRGRCASRDAGRPTWCSCTADSAAAWNRSWDAIRGRSGCNGGAIGPEPRRSYARTRGTVRRWSPSSRNVRRTCMMPRASPGRSILTIRIWGTSWGDRRNGCSNNSRSDSSTACSRTGLGYRTYAGRSPSRNPRPPSFPAWKTVNGPGHPPHRGAPSRLSLRPSWT